MRVAPNPRIALASVTLLATLAGCGSNTPAPTATDAGGSDTAVQADGASPVDGTAGADGAVADGATTADAAQADVPVDRPPVGSCGGIGPEVAAHVTAMNTTGWSALNRSHSMMMYGCAGTTRAQDCLASVPLADDTNIGGNRSLIPGAHLRVLYTSTNRSNYWTRSSPDGRFIARGTHLHDMSRGVEMEASGAMYDPAFFPDDSGFIYQPGGRMCPMSALTMGMPTSVVVSGAGSPCAGSSVGLYQHLGVSLDGSDYWATSAGNAAWDDGGHSATLTETHRNETWGPNAQVSLTLMANSGSGFTAVGSRSVTTPYQGDAVISPSGTLILARYVDMDGNYQGYILNRLDAMHTGAAIMASVTEIGRYCVQGAKPAFSFDERYAVYHHYIGGGNNADADAMELGFANAADPGFADYAAHGASNIYILDLLNGTTRRVTNMAPGQYALYPHFRSDGWMYFNVRTLGTPQESIVASDALFTMQ